MLAANCAAAEVVILKSDVPTFSAGEVMSDDKVLDIPAKKSVRVLLRKSGSDSAGVSKTITGPYKGTAKSYKAPIIGNVRKSAGSSDVPISTFSAQPIPKF